MKKEGQSWEHAPTPEGFKKLIEAAERTDHVSKYKFLLFLAGYCGLRSGEMTHIKLGWFNFEQGIILIPPHEPCNCTYCVKHARKKTKNPFLTPQEVRDIYWRPKFDASVRAVPYKLYDEVPEILEEYIIENGRYPYRVKSVEYVIYRLVKLAGGIKSAYGKSIHFHGLRAYAATQYAYADYSTWDICNVMGWKDIETASNYLVKLGVIANKLNKKNINNKPSFSYNESYKVISENKASKQETCKKISFEEAVWLNRYLKKN